MYHKVLSLLLLFVVVQLSTASLVCKSGYTLNPYSGSCLRRVTLKKTWDDAKAYCEQAGEYLAVLDSVSSIEWFENLRRTNPAWRADGWLYIGAKKISGVWKWDGRVKGQVHVAGWDNSQPSGNGNCMQVFDSYGTAGFSWDDLECHHQREFVCETEKVVATRCYEDL